jgi:hypothetical protein
LEWYSNRLIQHGADVLDAVLPAVREFNSDTDEKDWLNVGSRCLSALTLS